MSETYNVGDLVTQFLEGSGIDTAFGVISIHNMPILDAIGRRNRVRFVPSRGEAGAANMADAWARVTGGTGVCITSTGTGAGNAAGALVEAQTAGTPLLHITGQVERAHLAHQHAYIHGARDQLGMLSALGKGAFRIDRAQDAANILQRALALANSAPTGVVSVEIPIDVQQSIVAEADNLPTSKGPTLAAPDEDIDALADRLASCKRPLLWVGGGAKHAGRAINALLDMGFAMVSSTQGRGIVSETASRSLGAFTVSPAARDLYQSCDACLVIGSHLRGNETLKYSLPLPEPLLRIDVDPEQADHPYQSDMLLIGDATLTLEALVSRLDGRMQIDPTLGRDVMNARAAAETQLREGLGPYNALVDAMQAVFAQGDLWVRDITISNSTWGNRLPMLQTPRSGVHAAGGGIGQAVPMAIGAAIAGPGRKVFCLVGDGGLQLCLGELASAVEENADIVFVVMNSASYAVIRNIQDAAYGGRNYFANLRTPNFARVCEAIDLAHHHVAALADIETTLREARAHAGPVMVEIDMQSVGDFSRPFAGPPVAKS